jgi:hypothetical protein
MYVFDIFVNNQLAVDVWIYFWNFYYIHLVYVSVLYPVPFWFSYYHSV